MLIVARRTSGLGLSTVELNKRKARKNDQSKYEDHTMQIATAQMRDVRPEYWMEYGSKLREKGIHVPLLREVDKATAECLADGMLDLVIKTAEGIKAIGEVKAVILPVDYLNKFVIRTHSLNIDLRSFPVEVLEVGKPDQDGDYPIWVQIEDLIV